MREKLDDLAEQVTDLRVSAAKTEAAEEEAVPVFGRRSWIAAIGAAGAAVAAIVAGIITGLRGAK